MCSIERDPRRDDHTICTTVAPELVFTVRTYATTAPYGPRLVHKSAPAANRTTRSQPYRITNPATVIRVRSNNRVIASGANLRSGLSIRTASQCPINRPRVHPTAVTEGSAGLD
jgi:hypothetical protein